MKGHLLLEGGAEFGGGMKAPDQRAIELAGGLHAAIRILPTAAAPDRNDRRAGQNGVRWFQSLGASDVRALPLIDRESAQSEQIAQDLRMAQLVYLLGGFPAYLGQTLEGSRGWQAVEEAFQAGAVVGGSSAGAMVLCESYYDPYEKRTRAGLNLLPGACVLPHHNRAGRDWAGQLGRALPHAVLIGIDEQTGIINDGPERSWTVYGQGAVTLYRQGGVQTFLPGDHFSLESSPGGA